jgi:hippurate hydrolase
MKNDGLLHLGNKERNTMNSDILHSAINEIFPELVGIRRTIHQIPELSFQEYNTSALIQKELSSIGLDFTVLANTGVVAEFGNENGRCVALRADIDALPIVEENDIPYKSTIDGVMHACGHDMHTTMLLGATKILYQHKDILPGKVKVVFQPGEEKTPGGASILLQEGLLELGQKPDMIFGQHVDPDASVGTVSFAEGPMLASADELYWTLRGHGVHAAQPHKGNDVIVAASALIQHLQTIVSRMRNPLYPGVLSVASIHAGSATNILPEELTMMGTLRSFNNEWRFEALEKIKVATKEICELYGVEGVCNPSIGYPPLVTDSFATSIARSAARNVKGIQKIENFEPKMWAEDFAFYAEKIPACFWMLGVKPLDVVSMPGLHNPRFLPEEDAMKYGIAMFIQSTFEFFSQSRDIA